MRKILIVCLGWLCALTAAAQFQTPVKFSVKQNKISDTEVELVFTGQIDAGWHVYTTDIPEDGPTRAEITLEKQQGVKPKGKLKTKGKVHKAMDEMFGMELSYMEGTATFVQTLTITEEKYEVAGYLTYGACNDENCIPPTDVEFSFSGEGKPAAVKEAEKAKEEKQAEKPAAVEEPAEAAVEEAIVPDTVRVDTAAVTPAETPLTGLYTPVIEELQGFGEENAGTSDKGLMAIFLLGLAGGLLALLTHCI